MTLIKRFFNWLTGFNKDELEDRQNAYSKGVRLAMLYRKQQELIVQRAKAKKNKKAVAPFDKALRANRIEAMKTEMGQ